MTAPRVSVLMPVYNGEKYLRTAVESILGQSFRDFEFLIVDDGSVDATPEILASFRDPRLKVVRQPSNMGVAAGLNRVMFEARGEYVVRMDSDDIAVKNRLELQVGFLDKHPSIALCGGAVKRFGEVRGIVRYPLRHPEIQAQMLFNPAFAHPAVAWRRNAFDELGLCYEDEIPTAEDYDLWVRACRVLEAGNMDAVLLNYRVDRKVKLSAYVQQQLDGARRIRADLLAPWSASISKGEWELHHRICEGSESPDKSRWMDGRAWLSKMAALNLEIPLVDAEALSTRLAVYLYDWTFAHMSHLSMADIRSLSEKRSGSDVFLSGDRLRRLLIRKLIRSGSKS